VQNKNILNNFKRVLGEYCAINQFVELSKRSLLTEQSILSNRAEFVHFANNNLIALTCYDPQKMVHSLSLSYIVNVHLCFETFLKELYQQIKHYGIKPLKEKSQDVSLLKCVCCNIYGERFYSEIAPINDLCDYYRLVRNSAVHDLCDVETYSSEYKKLFKYGLKNILSMLN
jgi:hypothetical protein